MSENREHKLVFGLGATIVVLLLLSVIGLALFRILFVNFVDNYELGYMYDSRTGKITILDKSGYFVSPPFIVKVHTIDLRPHQVCMNANSRVLNCKLVQFDKAGLDEFLRLRGRGDYSYSGSDSMDGGKLSGIMMSYAFEKNGKPYPFLKVLKDLSGDTEPNSQAVTDQSPGGSTK